MKRIAAVCAVLCALMLFSGCRLRRNLDASAATPTLPIDTSVPATQTPQAQKSTELQDQNTPVAEQTAQPQTTTSGNEQDIAGIIKDINGLDSSTKDIYEPEDSDLLVP